MGFNYFSTTPLAVPGVARAVYDGLASQNSFARMVQQKQLQLAERQVRLQELQAESDKAYRESQAKFQQLAADDRDEDRKLAQRIEDRNQKMFDFTVDNEQFRRKAELPTQTRLKLLQEERLRRGQVLDEQQLDYSNRYLQHNQERLIEDRRQFDVTREDEISGVRRKGQASGEPGRMSDTEKKRYEEMEKAEAGIRERATALERIAAQARKAEDEAAAKLAGGAPDSPATRADQVALRRARLQRQEAEAQMAKLAEQADEVAKQRNAYLDTLERARQPGATPQASSERVIRQLSNQQIVEDFVKRGRAAKLNLNEINRKGALNRLGQLYNQMTDEEREFAWQQIIQRYGRNPQGKR